MMKVSLALIFRNERDYLPQAVESAEALCDEFILVDSGSSDGSASWAMNRSKNDPRLKYYLRPWPGNFADQRNFSVSKATGDWILVLDADEKLEVPAAFDKRMLQTTSASALSIEIRNYTDDFTELGFVHSGLSDIARGYVPTKLHRLFRRDSRIAYTGVLHERIEPSLEANSLKTESSSLIIHHFGKLKEVNLGTQAQRYSFYQDLGLKKIAENPNDPQAHWELGVIYQKQRKLDLAEGAFRKALDLAPATPEFESYYLLSLFHQNAWPRILKYSPKTRQGEFFVALAKAESDTTALPHVLTFSDLFSQAPLLAFEIALRTKAAAQLETIRKAAAEKFEGSGYIEFLEASYLRRNQRYQEAIPLLQRATHARLSVAYQEYLICLIKTEQMPKVIDFFQQLAPIEKNKLTEDSLKMIDIAHLSLGLSRDEILQLRARYAPQEKR